MPTLTVTLHGLDGAPLDGVAVTISPLDAGLLTPPTRRRTDNGVAAFDLVAGRYQIDTDAFSFPFEMPDEDATLP